MKYNINKLALGDGIIRYTVQTKKHWWNKWHYIMDGNQPQLFSREELKKAGVLYAVEYIRKDVVEHIIRAALGPQDALNKIRSL